LSNTLGMGRIRVVLVRPQVAGNIGAVARLLENFNTGPLYLVAPQADPHSRESLQRSTHGEHRLQSAHIVSTLEQALDGVAYTIGTSQRSGPVHQPRTLVPRDWASQLRAYIQLGEVALLFGTEDTGLSREDLLACDAVVQIPAAPNYPTLNLSHAVAICLYEAFLVLAELKQTDLSTRPTSEQADAALIHRLIDKLQHALGTIGYLHPEKPDHLMFPIRSILSRARLTRTEAQILIGLAQQIDEFAEYGR